MFLGPSEDWNDNWVDSEPLLDRHHDGVPFQRLLPLEETVSARFLFLLDFC